jgi:phosphoglycerol transferase MdoB-like AlkP superfamily enzyme
MSLWVDIARIATGLNLVLLLGLAYIWGRNFAELRTKHPLGLLVFSLFLLAENAFALYYYLLDPTLSVWFNTQVPVIAWRAMMVLHVLETAGLLFLTWVTWD